jgi:hypothetical protein
MKIKFLLFLTLLLAATGAFAQDDAIGKYFGKYLDDPRVSVVSISPKMFRLLSKANWDTIPVDLKQTISRLQSLRIISTDSNANLSNLLYQLAKTHIDKNEYDELIAIRHFRDNVHFYIKMNGNTIHELVMIAVDQEDFTMMSFVGDIDLDKFSRLAADMDIKGMENLKNVKRK